VGVSAAATRSVLVALYSVLALAAGARASVQIATRLGHAPMAYLCSALAAAVYLVIAVALRRPSPQARRLATLACSAEFAGVLIVGTATLADAGAFPDETVWSGYGSGYGFVPLLLPPLALWWLLRSGPALAPAPEQSCRAPRNDPAGSSSR
jgi:hypothetical protein